VQQQVHIQADQYLLTVGKLTQNATITDLVLFGAFKVLAGCSHEVGHAIYYSLESVAAKGRMVRRVLNVAGDDQDAAALDAIIRSVEKAHTPRNELAHAILTAQGDPGGAWVRVSPKAQKQASKPVTEPYLKSLMDQSATAVREAHEAFNRLCEKRGVQPELKIS
jgi:hypothetical protein